MIKKMQSNGFSAIEAVVVTAVVAVLGVGGWAVWHAHQSNKVTANNSSQTTSATQKKPSTPDPYAGWNTSTSSRGNFSIKYPVGWTYGETTGSKDNVEHITIDSTAFHITIDSFRGKDTLNGGQPATTCVDCLQTIDSTSFAAGKLDLKTVTYKLDNGQGNALILMQADSTYYIPSLSRPEVYTSFRGISALDSKEAYQAETRGQFAANADYAVAKRILQSVSY